MLVDANASNPAVTGAIRHAAQVTGTSFQYLLATAQVESNFNPNAGAATSSARGLFQFIEQTWLATLKEQGTALGYGRYANAIGRTPAGDYVVTDPRLYQPIMNLRTDPAANAMMAGAFTRDNETKLGSWLGRKPTEGELYVAHFLGPAGASRLIELAETAPRTRAAGIFPNAARANPSIFYGRQGARSASEVYRMLVGRYDVARGSPASTPAMPIARPAAPAPAAPAPAVAQTVAVAPVTAPTARNIQPPRTIPVQVAATQVTTAKAIIPPPAEPPSAAVPAAFPDTASLAETYAAAARLSAPPEQMADAAPVFHGLFRTSERREAVAPIVSALWTAPTAQPPIAAPAGPPNAAAAERPAAPLDLFQEQAPDIRALFRGRV